MNASLTSALSPEAAGFINGGYATLKGLARLPGAVLDVTGTLIRMNLDYLQDNDGYRALVHQAVAQTIDHLHDPRVYEQLGDETVKLLAYLAGRHIDIITGNTPEDRYWRGIITFEVLGMLGPVELKAFKQGSKGLRLLLKQFAPKPLPGGGQVVSAGMDMKSLVAKIKTVRGAGKVVKGGGESIDELAELVDGSYRTVFRSDLADEAFRLKVAEEPALIDAWKALREFPNLRKIPSNLTTLNKIKGKFVYNGKIGQAALEEIFTSHKSAQKYIDNLGKAEELFDGVGVKHWGGIKSSGEVRLVNDAGVVVGKVEDGKFIVTAAKGSRPAPSTYLTQKYINDHLAKFDSEGGAFIVVKSWIEDGGYNAFPLRKYAMLKSDIRPAIAKYKKSGNITDLEDALGYSRGDLAGLEDELYVFYPDKSKFKFEIPDGNEIGANHLWEPGGNTSGGFREAVLIDKSNPLRQIVHNNDINVLKGAFSWKKIND